VLLCNSTAIGEESDLGEFQDRGRTGRRVLAGPPLRRHDGSGRRVLKADLSVFRSQPAGGRSGRRVLKGLSEFRLQPGHGRRVLKGLTEFRLQPGHGRRVLKPAFAEPRSQPAGGRRVLKALKLRRPNDSSGRRNLKDLKFLDRSKELSGRRNLKAMPLLKRDRGTGRRNLKAMPLSFKRDRGTGRRNLFELPRMKNDRSGRRNLEAMRRNMKDLSYFESLDEETELSSSEEDSEEVEIANRKMSRKPRRKSASLNKFWKLQKKAAKKACRKLYDGEKRKQCKRAVQAKFH